MGAAGTASPRFLLGLLLYSRSTGLSRRWWWWWGCGWWRRCRLCCRGFPTALSSCSWGHLRHVVVVVLRWNVHTFGSWLPGGLVASVLLSLGVRGVLELLWQLLHEFPVVTVPGNDSTISPPCEPVPCDLDNTVWRGFPRSSDRIRFELPYLGFIAHSEFYQLCLLLLVEASLHFHFCHRLAFSGILVMLVLWNFDMLQ